MTAELGFAHLYKQLTLLMTLALGLYCTPTPAVHTLTGSPEPNKSTLSYSLYLLQFNFFTPWSYTKLSIVLTNHRPLHHAPLSNVHISILHFFYYARLPHLSLDQDLSWAFIYPGIIQIRNEQYPLSRRQQMCPDSTPGHRYCQSLSNERITCMRSRGMIEGHQSELTIIKNNSSGGTIKIWSY